jgi:hypothetical protein
VEVRTDLIALKFGELLLGLRLPPYWCEIMLEKMLKAAQKTDLETELQVEMAVVELALRGMDVPEMDGLRLDDIIKAGERLPGIVALWEAATP